MLNRFCEAYPEDERLQEELALPTVEDSLVRVGPGLPRAASDLPARCLPGRLHVKFLEFNADSPAGIGYTDVLHEGLRQTISLPRVEGEFDTAYTPMLPRLDRDAARRLPGERAARQERSQLPEAPRLALVDVPGQPLRARVPHHLRAPRPRRGHRGNPRHHDELAYDGSMLTRPASRSSSSTAGPCSTIYPRAT